MLKELPNVTEEELLVDLRFYEYLIAYRDMVTRKAAEKGRGKRAESDPRR